MALSVNRETKIGLAVLSGLLVVFAVVLAWRLTRPEEAAAVPPAPENAEAAAKPVSRRPQPESQAPTWMAAKPALLSPAGPPSTAPKPALDDAGSWSAEADARTPRSDGSRGRTVEGTASLMPGARVLAAATADRYEVQPNDSYWTISEKVYGTADYFRALAEHNRGKAAPSDRLPPGLVVSVPAVTQLEHDYPSLCPTPDTDSLEPADRTARRPQSGYPR